MTELIAFAACVLGTTTLWLWIRHLKRRRYKSRLHTWVEDYPLNAPYKLPGRRDRWT